MMIAMICATVVSGAMQLDWSKPETNDRHLTAIRADVREKVMVATIPGEGELPSLVCGFRQTSQGPYWPFVGDRRLPLASYPRDGRLYIDEIERDFGSIGRTQEADRPEFTTFKVKMPREQLERLARETEMVAHGAWKFAWADATIPITRVEVENGAFTAPAKEMEYGIKTGDTSGGYFQLRNVFSAIEQPGDWAVDRAARRIYIYPPKEGVEKIKIAAKETLLHLKGAADLVIEDKVFEYARKTAVILEDCTNVVIRRSVVRNSMGLGINIRGGKNCRVEGCDLYNLGEGGVWAVGGEQKTLTPGGHVVINNHIHHFGQWAQDCRFGILVKGVGNRCEHNLVHHCPHIAICFLGNDQYVGWNVVHDTCIGNYDCSAIYTHTKNEWYNRGNVVEHNLVHMSGSRTYPKSTMGIYVDGWSSGDIIRDNIVSRCTHGLFQNGGNDNLWERNIVVGCGVALHITNHGRRLGKPIYPTYPYPARGRDSVLFKDLEKFLAGADLAVWTNRYPKMMDVYKFEDAVFAQGPINVVTRNNVAAWSGEFDFEDQEVMAPYQRHEGDRKVQDIGFVDYEGLNFELREDSPIRKLFGGGTRFAEMGLFESEWRVSPAVKFGEDVAPTRRKCDWSAPEVRVAIESESERKELKLSIFGSPWPDHWYEYKFKYVPTKDDVISLRLAGGMYERTAYDEIQAEGCEIADGGFEAGQAWQMEFSRLEDNVWGHFGITNAPYGVCGETFGIKPYAGARQLIANYYMTAVQRGIKVKKGVPITIRLKARACMEKTPLDGISFETPKTWPCEAMNEDDLVKTIWLEGEPYQGKPTRVFAYYAVPKAASAEHKVPGMVLAHGGGGTAFANWVRTWAERGYAAIAVDNCGCLPIRAPDGKGWLKSGVGGPQGWDCAEDMNKPVGDQWPYHAVGATVRAHSFLRSLPGVDKGRIGLTGISWGGFLTMLTAAIDKRFVFAAPVYTCANYEQSPLWQKVEKKDARWLANWEPAQYVRKLDLPVVWSASTNDKAFPFAPLCDTFAMLPNPPTLAIRKGMRHAHGPAGENVPEIFEFARHYLRGGNPLPRMGAVKVAGERLEVDFDAHGRKVTRFEVIWTTEAAPNFDTKWQVSSYPAEKAQAKFAAPLPKGAARVVVNMVLDGPTNEPTYPEAVVSSVWKR